MDRSLRKFILLTALSSACAMPAHALDYSIYGQAGLFGLGGGAGIAFSNDLQARIGYGAFNYGISDITDEDEDTGSEVTYDADLKWSAGTALVDWHPFSGSFHLTGGLALNGSKIDVSAKPVSGTYDINGNTYTAEQVGSVKGSLDFGGAAPYLGIGWGHAVATDGRFSFLLDLGVMFTGKPDVSLKANCNASPQVCAQLNRDVLAEEDNLKDETKDFDKSLVVNFMVGYRF